MTPTIVEGPILMLDTSEILHGENQHQFRNYEEKESEIFRRVRKTYYLMHEKQTVDYVRGQRSKWLKFNHAEMTIMEALELLNNIKDESDPDTDMPNIVHAFQTAEKIRQVHPDKPWFQLVGLIHDLGKVLAFFEEPHWAVCGDTFPVGCQPDPSIVFGMKSFENNEDLKNEAYCSRLGIYKEKCGIDNLLMSWGHDEYLYQVLKANASKLPDMALKVIRFHSFYPWHKENAYQFFMTSQDEATLEWVREFNKFDLYTKTNDVPDISQVSQYYQTLIDHYCPGILKF